MLVTFCGHGGAKDTDIVMLAPVSVHAAHLRQGIGSAMIKLGILPDFEIAEVKLFDELPDNLTYLELTRILFDYLKNNNKN